MIGIPGGTVRILHHAFMAEFGSSSTPVDVLVVGTVNDVMRGKDAPKIIRDLRKFKNDVLSMKTQAGENLTTAILGLYPSRLPLFIPGDSKLRN